MIVRAIVPADDLKEQVVTSVAPEDDTDEWVAGTYTEGQERWLASTHSVYRCAVASTTENPADSVANATGAWAYLRPTNAYKMFSDSVYEQTVSPTTITLTYDSSGADEFVDSACFFNLAASSIEVWCTSVIAGGEFFRERKEMIDYSRITDLYEYRRGSIQPRLTSFYPQWMQYSDTIVNIEIANSGGDVKVGKVIVGNNFNVGSLEAGAQSTTRTIGKTRTVNGIRQFVASGIRKSITGVVAIESGRADYVSTTVGSKLGAVPVGVSADSRYDSMQTYGVLSMTLTWMPNIIWQKASFKVESAE